MERCRDAADVELLLGTAVGQCILQRRPKRRVPIALKSQQAAKYGDQRLRRVEAACMRYGANPSGEAGEPLQLCFARTALVRR